MTKKIKHNKLPQEAHNEEFRDTAIKLALTGDKPVAQVAKELGLEPKRLYAWISAWKKKNRQPINNGKSSADDALRQLQKRNKQLEMENEILKKAAAYFAKTLL